MKLPKLELTHFKGDVTTWTSWWDNYEATIHKSDLPDVTKFTYLRSLLDSEAAAVIKGLKLTSDNYGIACNLLKERFGRKELIIFSHIQNLMSSDWRVRQASSPE
ncbi:hypothetical protein LOTGIDRAFT_111232 [Lottia gigantea]|uniref:Uncharacterized protein n=1 Tax=Lottia gigantea TaxID=225164 RepID=V4B3X1_LOTGI|nr:hypothetical protein LOTGIDRAFT_111232 [Lottia gigantea]ESP02106.1 hypothetical protein LOTGIDRAFT_111232 [Lottia gigantea]